MSHVPRYSSYTPNMMLEAREKNLAIMKKRIAYCATRKIIERSLSP